MTAQPATPSEPSPTVPTVPEPASPDLPNLADITHAVLAWTADHVSVLAAAAALFAAALAARICLRRRARRRRHTRARSFTVISPANLEPADAVAGARRLWRSLTTLAPQARWARLAGPPPHLAVEHHLADGEITTRVWIPGDLPHAPITVAIAAAWPGAQVIETPEPDLPHTGAVTGVQVQPRHAGHLPLRAFEAGETAANPLRDLEAASADLAPGEHLLVQVLARPLTGRGLRRHQHAAAHVQQGRPARTSVATALITGTVRAVLEIVTPSRSPGARTTNTTSPAPDAARAERQAAVRHKAAEPTWEVAMRYLVRCPGNDRTAERRARSLAHTAFAVFAHLHGAHNTLIRRRIAHPHAAIVARRMRHGTPLSATELAWLTHPLPRTPELSGGTAPRVPAPPEALIPFPGVGGAQ